MKIPKNISQQKGLTIVLGGFFVACILSLAIVWIVWVSILSRVVFNNAFDLRAAQGLLNGSFQEYTGSIPHAYFSCLLDRFQYETETERMVFENIYGNICLVYELGWNRGEGTEETQTKDAENVQMTRDVLQSFPENHFFTFLHALFLYTDISNKQKVPSSQVNEYSSTVLKSIEYYPERIYFIYRHGIELNRLEAYNASTQAFSTILDQYPEDQYTHGRTYKERCYAYAKLGEREKARKDCKKAEELLTREKTKLQENSTLDKNDEMTTKEIKMMLQEIDGLANSL